MSKSPLSRACYALDAAEVRRLIAAGAAVDGSDGGVWRGDADGCRDGAPYYTPLGEACRSSEGSAADALAVVESLLAAGAPVDGRNYRNETALHFAAGAGRPDVIRRLLAAGADVTATSFAGDALQVLMTYFTPEAPDGPKVEALGVLLTAGSEARGVDTSGRDLLALIGEGPFEALQSRRRTEKSRGRAMLQLMRLIGEYEPEWAALQRWLARAEAARLAGDAQARKAQMKIDALLAEAGGDAFVAKVRRALGKSPAGREDALALLTRELLMHPTAVAHPAWAELVGALLDLTVDYGEITEQMYGLRLSIDDMDEDEGGALEMYADEGLSTVELCLLACRAPGASDRPDFSALVRAICETKHARIGAMSFGDDEAAALIALLERRRHPEAAALRDVARRCFPFADWR